ncbi:peptidoglycan-binding domain-containing protein [Brunnivagina elsteri]|uniref:Peptidoglycan binding-like domain-containing protein n=1 Tax=Brunnivagina elsteri CCALA 953 TaxID=987040 RepID=A0A2A2THN0_9CYAN|nr:peptidoglycan-binding protein [Calothrix elsteri]PAX53191.1 hypothetical protein CK510_15235 [Calothrix elsteri CCALA 953]
MSTATFTRLQEGSTGSAVTKLQQRLKTLKFYTGAVDGVFGANTKAAVIKYQQSKAVQFNDVTVDGIVGYVTESSIQRDIWLSQRQPIKEGSQGKDVQLLQQILKTADDINKDQGQWNMSGGFGVGSVDGVFGATTKAAVIKFQQVEKLNADGVVGALTWDRLAGIVAFDLDAIGVVANNVYDLTTRLPIKEGSATPDVFVIQDLLTVLKLYNSGQIDGKFGAKTKEAVIKFQTANGLKADGIVGEKTAIALSNQVWLATKPVLKEGSKGEAVEEFQGLYNSYFGTLTVDGNFGAKTKAEVIKFQKSRNLTADGVVGAKTWSSLRSLTIHDIPVEQQIAFIFDGSGGC